MSKTEKITKIVSFLEEYEIKNATINKDFTVDVNGSVSLSRKKLYKIPIQFGRVNGNFWCSENYLTTLEGCPKHVKGIFSCMRNRLITLKGGPEYVEGDFYCESNKLKSLKYSPKEVAECFYCEYNPDLKSLKGIGVVHGKIYSDFFEGKLEDYKG